MIYFTGKEHIDMQMVTFSRENLGPAERMGTDKQILRTEINVSVGRYFWNPDLGIAELLALLSRRCVLRRR